MSVPSGAKPGGPSGPARQANYGDAPPAYAPPSYEPASNKVKPSEKGGAGPSSKKVNKRVSQQQLVGGGLDEPQVPGYKDVPFAILFGIAMLSIVILALAFLNNSMLKNNNPNDSDSAPAAETVSSADAQALFGAFFLACVVGAVFAYAWLKLAQHKTKEVIYGSMICVVVFLLLFAIAMAAMGNVIGAIFALIICGIMCFIFYIFRHRIPFAVAVLKCVIELVFKYPATIAIAFGSLPALVVLAIVWVLALSNFTSYIAYFYLLFCFYWGSQVIKNVVHVSVVGGFASWYFAPSDDQIPENPTAGGLKRACTTAFGSICFGSLIVAAWKTFRAIVRSLFDRNSFIGKCIDCILGCLEGYLQYFNKYSYVQVGIYGKSYCDSAKDTFNMMSTAACGDAIINDNIIGAVTGAGVLLGALFTGILCLLYGFAISDNIVVVILSAFIGLLVAFVIINTCMEVVTSGVAAIFVCWAKESDAIRHSRPELYQVLAETLGTNRAPPG